MPLPGATPPDQSRLYEQLKTSKLEDLTADQLDAWRDQIFADSENEDEIRRLILLYLAAGRFSIATGPMIRESKIVRISDVSTDQIIFQPSAGEVWELMTGDILETNGSATFTVGWNMKDAAGDMAFMGTTSTTGQEPIMNDLAIEGPIYITSELYLWADRQAGEGRITIAVIRRS